MNQCKKCGTPIEKGTDVCPICGVENPLENIAMETGYDLTKTFTPVEPEYQLTKQKSRLVTWLLGLGLGFTGAPFFYLGFIKLGVFWLLFSGILVVLPLILIELPWLLYVCYGGLGALNVILALYYAIPHDQKDARGEYLK